MSEDTDDKPAGWDPIDYNILPEAQQKVVSDRVNHLYSQLKTGERANRELANMNKGLISRLEALENATVENKASQIQNQIAEAVEDGDSQKVATLTAELAEIKSKPAGPAQDSKSEEPDDGQEPTDNLISMEDQALLESWAMAMNEDGSYLRPWMQDGDPNREEAEEIFRGLTQTPSLMSKGVKALMARMDTIMGTSKPQRKQSMSNVLTGGGEAPPKTKTSRWTPEMEEAARLMNVSKTEYQKFDTMMQEQKAAGDVKYRVSFPDD